MNRGVTFFGVLAVGLLIALVVATMEGQGAGKPVDTTVTVYVDEIKDLEKNENGGTDFYFEARLYRTSSVLVDYYQSSVIQNQHTANFDLTVDLEATLPYGDYCYVKIDVLEVDAAKTWEFDVSPSDATWVWLRYDLDENEFQYITTGGGWSGAVSSGTTVTLSGNGDPFYDGQIKFKVSDDVQDGVAPGYQLSVNPATPNGENGWYITNVVISISISSDVYWQNSECWLNVDVGDGYQDEGTSWERSTEVMFRNLQIPQISGSGRLELKFYTEDPSGNTGTVITRTINVDVNLPTVSNLDGPDTWVSNPKYHINWSYLDLMSGIASFYYAVDGGSYRQTTEACVTLFTPPDGDHSFTVYAKDMAGLTSAVKSFDFKVDQTLPIISNLKGPVGWTSEDEVRFNWTGEDATSGIMRYRCRIDEGDIVPTNIERVRFDTPEDGTHTFYVQAMDNATNLCDWVSYEFKVDRTDPVIRNLTGPDGWTSEHPIMFTWEGVDEGSGIKRYHYKVDDGPSKPFPRAEIGVNVPEDGDHTFYVQAEDKAGTVCPWRSYEFKVDRTAPTVTGLAGPADWVNDPFVKFTWTGKDEGSGILRYHYRTGDGSEKNTTNPTVTFVPLVDGVQTFHVCAEDVASNMGEWAEVEFKVDRVRPTMTKLTAPTDWITTDTFPVTWEGKDTTSGIDRYLWRYSGGDWEEGSSPLKVTTPADGGHRLEVMPVDLAGNKGRSMGAYIRVDRTGPEIIGAELSSGGLDTGSTIVMLDVEVKDSVAGSYIHLVEVKVGTTDWQDFELDEDKHEGIVTVRVALPSDPGSHELTIRATDEAGNVGAEGKVTLNYDPTLKDEFGPSIFDMAPSDGAQIIERRPTISASYSEETTGGSGIDMESVTFMLDDIDRTSGATVTASGISYETPFDLPMGEHTVKLSVRDESANRNIATKTWTFTILEKPIVMVSISIEPSSFVVEVGQTVALVVVGVDEDDRNHRDLTVEWEVEGGIGSILDGTFEAETVGEGKVIATFEDLSAETRVSVVEETLVTRIEVSPSEVTLEIGEGHAFVAACYDGDDNVIEGVACTWSMTGTAGHIDGAGYFYAREEGEATVTATFKEVTASATITVRAPERTIPDFTIESATQEGTDLVVVLSIDGELPDDAEMLMRIDTDNWVSATVDVDGRLVLDISDLEAGDHTLKAKILTSSEVSDEQSTQFTSEDVAEPEEITSSLLWIAVGLVAVIAVLALLVIFLKKKSGET